MGYPISEEEVLAIHNAKLMEIKGALDDLFVIGMATGLYKKASTDMDYKTFEKQVKETFEFFSGDKKSTFEKINSVLREMAPGETFMLVLRTSGKIKKLILFICLYLLIIPHQTIGEKLLTI